MTEITVAVIDDFESAHVWMSECFGTQFTPQDVPKDFVRDNVRLAGHFRVRLVETTEMQIRRALRSHKGPLLLFLDLTLQLREERLDTIIHWIEKLINRVHRAEPHPGSSKALKYLQGLSDVNAKKQVEGVWIALAAIGNRKIQPLHIKIATSGTAGECKRILEILGKKYRSPECFRVEEIDTSLTELRGHYDPPETKGWKEIVEPAVEKLRTSIRECSAITEPAERLEAYLSWIGGAHNDLDKLDGLKDPNNPGISRLEEFVRPNLLAFLGLPPEDWSSIWDNLSGDHGVELLKNAGTYSRCRLCVSGGWLLALAAFQTLKSPTPWRDVFTPDDPSKEDGWTSSYLTPILSVPGANVPDNLHDVMRRFFELCLLLFRPKPGFLTSPLVKVKLSRHDGLEFLLAFDAWSDKRGWEESLVAKIMKWRDAYVRDNSGYSWVDRAKEGHSTSRALWDWWLVTSFGDFTKVMFSDGFGLGDHWKLRLERTNDMRTRVVFRER